MSEEMLQDILSRYFLKKF